MQFIDKTATWSAAFLAFLGGAATAAGVVPVVLYSASQDLIAVLIVLCGLAVTPFGGLVGLYLRNRLMLSRSGGDSTGDVPPRRI